MKDYSSPIKKRRESPTLPRIRFADSCSAQDKLSYKIKKLTLEEKIKMIHAAGLFRTGAIQRLDIPALVMSDGPSGVRQEFENDDWNPIDDTTDYVSWLPSNTCLCSTWNPELARSFGEVLGEEARGRGKDIILAPGINIKRTPLCGRNFEYMSEDPALTGQMAVPLIQGIQAQDVAACVKHYALNNQEADRMSVNTIVDDKTLYELYLPAFHAAVTKGQSYSIMGAYNKYAGSFCCENETLLQTILRDEWHYDGVTISDWGGVHHTGQTALHGVDIEMSVTPDFDDYKLANPLLEKIEKGEIPESVIDERLERIFKMMERIHLGEESRKKGRTNTPEHQQIIQQIAEEGIVLLKNEKGQLPLKKNTKKLLVIGDNAKRTHAAGGGSSEIKALYDISPLLGLRMVLGGDTQIDWLPGYYVDNEKHVTGEVDWQAESLDVDYTTKQGSLHFDTKIQPIRKQYLQDALDAVPAYDEILFIGGLNHASDVEGFDRNDMKLPYGQDEVISALADATEHLTVVLINGAPVEMPWADKVSSLIQTSYCGMQGGYAMARILFGDVNPSGHLSETYPLCLADTPTEQYHSYPGELDEHGQRHVTYTEKLMVGYRYYSTQGIPVRFPFGHGLSYTTFACHDFTTTIHDKETPTGQDTAHYPFVTVSCKIQNTGKRAGKETIQLYVGIPEDGQPKLALRTFAKTSLEAGEEKEIRFVLTKRDFATYSISEKCFVAKPGTYHLYVGTSAETILYDTKVELSQI